MDIWSLACVIVELMIGGPLFAGGNELEQLILIARVLGAPPPRMVEGSKRRREFFDALGRLRLLQPTRAGSTPLESILKTADPHLLDFLKKCLRWEPSERLTAAEGLLHPFVNMKRVMLNGKQNSVGGILPSLTEYCA
jgi:dual specificity tyrosine-phosphorylation-regulated kinase 2/3/4